MFGSIHHNFGGNIKLFIAGGAAIDPKVIEDFEAMGFPMIQGYGMSECAPIIAVNQDRYSKAASVGKPMPGTEVKIINPDEDGVGEVVCKSDSVMLGYYENEEETAPSNEPCPCRDLDPAEALKRVEAGEAYVIRQKLPRTGTTGFSDSVFGDIEIENKVLDDQILLKQDGMPTYNFANVIDDHLMGITHVVRGCEYLSSTPKYNLLYKAFGWEIPTYVHLPLIMGKDAEGNVSKLSKRHGSVSFENLVEEGFLPEAIVNYISFLGWNPKSDREIFSLSELAEVFSLAGLNKAPAVFDYTKLRWMNSEHLKMMESSTFAQLAKPFAKIEGTVLENKWPVLAELIRSRIETLTEIPEKIAFFLQLPEFDPEMYNNKKSKCTPEVAKSILEELIPQFDALEEFTPDTVNPLIEGYAAAHEVKLGQPMWAVRISLSGLPATPGGPAEIMSVLGKEESMRRLNAGLAKLG
jgi:glutamyl-tRNA synthetase